MAAAIPSDCGCVGVPSIASVTPAHGSNVTAADVAPEPSPQPATRATAQEIPIPMKLDRRCCRADDHR
jgi:hypothetical protein